MQPCLLLRPIVFSPDVKHENAGDEKEGHDQDWDGSNFDSGKVVRVEPPHSTGGSASRPGCGSASATASLGTAATAPLAHSRAASGTRAAGTHRRRAGCWSGHIVDEMKSKN